MTDKRMLIVDDELLSMIDENRGDLSRNEFISCLIDNAVNNNENTEATPQVRNQYLQREEFEKFTYDMRELLKHFLDFFLNDKMVINDEPKDGHLEELTHQLQSLSANGLKNRKTR